MQKRGRFGLRCRELTDARQRLLFDPDFSKPEPPPPFNWALTSSTVGLAERQPGGRLHAIFYGQEDGALARQLLVLPPGRYHFSMRLLRRFDAGQGTQLVGTCPGAQEAWPVFRSNSRRRAA